MRLITIDRPAQGRAGAILGAEALDFGLAGAVLPLARWIPPSMAAVLAVGDEGLEIVRRLVDGVQAAGDTAKNDLRAEGALIPLDQVRLKAPVPRPGILLSHGRSYGSHVQEMKPGDKAPEQPIGFMKNVHAIIGSGCPIVLPRSADQMVDFEAEISVVFSRPCQGVSEAEAMDSVLGFTIVNDVSARDWVPQMGQFPELNRMGKQFPGFCPMGPAIVTLDEIADPQDMHLVTRLNGQVMQDAWTRDLIWSLPALIAYYARWYPFQAGDVMTTGTPAGVGYGRDPKVFMRPGDIVSITVDGVGELANPVVAPPSNDHDL